MNGQVDIVVERQWHAPALARTLMREDRLGHVFTGFPKNRYTSHGIPAEKICAHPFPAVWNLAVSKFGLPARFRRNEPRELANTVAANKKLSPVVTCLATSYQQLFPKLVSRPVVRVIECGSMHPEDHFHFQQRARREAGLQWTAQLPTHVTEEIEISKLAHMLVCGSRMVVESYVSRGYDPERVLLCPYGVDTDRFRFQQRQPPRNRPIRLATVGLIGIRKGILRLLRIAEWAKASGIPLELHLIGPVDPEAEHLISHSSADCRRHGVLKGNALVEALHQTDAYCLPSYEEGFPISQIEAMATGLPAITSNDTGGREAVTDGTDGIILSDFTGAEFDQKLKPWFVNLDRLTTAGSAAASKARELYSLDAYSKNAGACYASACDLAARLCAGESIPNAHKKSSL